MLKPGINIANECLKVGLSVLSFEPTRIYVPYAMALYAVNTLYYSYKSVKYNTSDDTRAALNNFGSGLLLFGFVYWAPATISMLALYMLCDKLLSGLINSSKKDALADGIIWSLINYVRVKSFASQPYYLGMLSITLLCSLVLANGVYTHNNSEDKKHLTQTLIEASCLFAFVTFAPHTIPMIALYLITSELARFMVDDKCLAIDFKF